METLWDLIEESAAAFGSKTALSIRRGYRTERWSYRYLRDTAARTAVQLRATGAQRGDRVLVWAPNMPEWVCLYFGCLRAGVVLVPLDVRTTGDFAARVKEQTAPRMLFTSRTVPVIGDTLGIPVRHLEDLPGWAAEVEHEDVAMSLPSANDMAEIMFTSGTTGDPKGVILTHRNIASNVMASVQAVPTKPSYRLLSLLPLSHMLEQTGGLLAPLHGGATIVYPASRQPSVIFRALREQRVTNLVLVPQALHLFWNAIEREVRARGKEKAWQRLLRVARRLPLSIRRALFRPVHRQLGGRLQFILCGGAYLDPTLAAGWEAIGIPILQGYGTTETSPVITANSLRNRRYDAVGTPLAGVDVRIADDGEILVRGPNVMQGYWRNPGATAAVLQDGWYKTGDLGQLDAKGRLYLRGRKKDMIVLASGMNVYAQDVEEALKVHPSVADACVIGHEGAGGRVQVHAVLLLKDPSADRNAPVTETNERLAEHQRIQGVTVWPLPDFPRTHTLKTKKQEVADYVRTAGAAGSLPPPATAIAATLPPLYQLVAQVAGVPVVEITPFKTLGGDLNLDSLARVELLAVIEAELGVYLDESQVLGATTVGEMETFMAAAGKEGRRPSFWRWPLLAPTGLARAALQSLVAFPLLRLRSPYTVEGGHHLAEVRGPVFFAANHPSHLDGPVVLAALPGPWRRRTTVAAAADIWFADGGFFSAVRRVFAALVFNAFPFSRTDAVRPSLEHCASLLDSGWSVLIFPEGKLSEHQATRPFKSGAGLMAVEMGVPVVPISLVNDYGTIKQRPGSLTYRRVRVRIGAPLPFAPQTSYLDATQAIEEAVRVLSDDSPPEDVRSASASGREGRPDERRRSLS